jgi:hypothetical protein
LESNDDQGNNQGNNQHQPTSSNIKQHQPTSTNINQHQATSTNINQHQLTSSNINQHQATSSYKSLAAQVNSLHASDKAFAAILTAGSVVTWGLVDMGGASWHLLK